MPLPAAFDTVLLTILTVVVVAPIAIFVLRMLEARQHVRLGPEVVEEYLERRCEKRIEALETEFEAEKSDWQRQFNALQQRYDALWVVLQYYISRSTGSVPGAGVIVGSKIRVLGVWPTIEGLPQLDYRSEIDAIFNAGVDYMSVNGEVTRSRLVRELDRYRPTVMHIDSHASAQGIMLSDGITPPGWWTNLVREHSIQLAFLNACQTLDVADLLHDAGIPAVIGMRHDIADAVGILFASEFYRWLAAGRTVMEAARLAKQALKRMDAEMIVVRGDWDPRS